MHLRLKLDLITVGISNVNIGLSKHNSSIMRTWEDKEHFLETKE